MLFAARGIGKESYKNYFFSNFNDSHSKKPAGTSAGFKRSID
jgi:hypothetical protein